MNSKKLGIIIGGVAFITIAIWILMTGNDATFRYLGSALFAILGSGTLFAAIKDSQKEV